MCNAARILRMHSLTHVSASERGNKAKERLWAFNKRMLAFDCKQAIGVGVDV